MPGGTSPYGLPTPPKRSHGVLIGVLIGLVVLVVAGGTAGLIALRSDDHKKPSGQGSSSASASASPSESPSASPSPTAASVTLASPARIGTLRKKADQSLANTLRQQMDTAGLENPYAVIYEDSTATTHTVAVWGGTGGLVGQVGEPQSELDAFFRSVGKQVGGGTVGSRVAVETGSVGGKGECAKVSGSGLTMTLCAWAGPGAVLGFLFGGTTRDKSSRLMRTMLPAIVVTR